MWTSKNRGRYDRSRLRYPSDLTDEEWTVVEPLIAPAKRGGNGRHVVVRDVVNGLMYILSTGCQWRAIAKDLPPRSTLYDYFDLWGWDGTLDRIHDALYAQCRRGTSAGGDRDIFHFPASAVFVCDRQLDRDGLNLGVEALFVFGVHRRHNQRMRHEANRAQRDLSWLCPYRVKRGRGCHAHCGDRPDGSERKGAHGPLVRRYRALH
jgi:transposase